LNSLFFHARSVRLTDKPSGRWSTVILVLGLFLYGACVSASGQVAPAANNPAALNDPQSIMTEVRKVVTQYTTDLSAVKTSMDLSAAELDSQALKKKDAADLRTESAALAREIAAPFTQNLSALRPFNINGVLYAPAQAQRLAAQRLAVLKSNLIAVGKRAAGANNAEAANAVTAILNQWTGVAPVLDAAKPAETKQASTGTAPAAPGAPAQLPMQAGGKAYIILDGMMTMDQARKFAGDHGLQLSSLKGMKADEATALIEAVKARLKEAAKDFQNKFIATGDTLVRGAVESADGKKYTIAEMKKLFEILSPDYQSFTRAQHESVLVLSLNFAPGNTQRLQVDRKEVGVRWVPYYLLQPKK
jgi:hypothetical protein